MDSNSIISKTATELSGELESGACKAEEIAQPRHDALVQVRRAVRREVLERDEDEDVRHEDKDEDVEDEEDEDAPPCCSRASRSSRDRLACSGVGRGAPAASGRLRPEVSSPDQRVAALTRPKAALTELALLRIWLLSAERDRVSPFLQTSYPDSPKMGYKRNVHRRSVNSPSASRHPKTSNSLIFKVLAPFWVLNHQKIFKKP